MAEIEDILVRHDPASLINDSNIISKLAYGGSEPVVFELHGRTVENVDFYNKNQQLAHQLHLNVERYKIAEALFKPYLVGVESRGISEILTTMYNSHEFTSIYLTGCMSKIPNLSDRILWDLQSNLPTNTKIEVSIDVEDQAYKGAYNYYQTAPESVYLKRKEYEEFGPEYMKEHAMSNAYTYYMEE